IAPAAAALAAAAPAPAAAQPAPAPAAPAVPQPARWHLDGATNRCVLSRRLEGTPVAATFILRTIPGSGRFDLILAAPDLPAELRRTNRPAILRFGPAGTPQQRPASPIDLPGRLGEGAAFGPLGAVFASEFARASTLDVADPQGRALGRWTIPAAARAAEALAACEAEKLVDWGADPAGFEPGARRPQPATDPSDWFSVRDFGLFNSTQSGGFTAVFRLAVGADGRASDCRLIESAGNVDLTGACRALAGRARYEPARDAAGNPIRSVAVYVADFRMDVNFRITG
ncbi:MAG TPA: hypothetical protein VEZ20_02820, partial [Allosphingosinicella sp.]|nr:hypothetical protein [Allosphingosinicella sp.]